MTPGFTTGVSSLALILLPVSGNNVPVVSDSIASVSPFAIIPFVLLLVSMAALPFINREWWEKRYPFISFGLAVVTLLYYWIGVGAVGKIGHVLEEYVSFIVLIGSLFIVAGGIVIRLKGKASPIANTITLLIGALVSNIIGTTGASMIMIRPYLHVNKSRMRPYHIVFFIFIVSNIGGALTPIGDPPLFLGYLMGVPFFWIFLNVWQIWILALGVLLILFFVVDTIQFKKALKENTVHPAEEFHEEAQVKGLQNIFFLFVILIAVFIQEPKYIRELLMLIAAGGSYFLTKKEIHQQNNFSFIPLKEVAILFLCIFITMVPALDWIEVHAVSIGLSLPGHYYWATGGLSSVLDNAPTYVNFLHAAIGLKVSPDAIAHLQAFIAARGNDITGLAPDLQRTMDVLRTYHLTIVNAGLVPVDDIKISYLIANADSYLKAISIGAVFFGALTYIGNGSNMLVKSIAEHHHAKCPSFHEYVLKYSLPILIPIFLIVWWVFF